MTANEEESPPLEQTTESKTSHQIWGSLQITTVQLARKLGNLRFHQSVILVEKLVGITVANSDLAKKSFDLEGNVSKNADVIGQWFPILFKLWNLFRFWGAETKWTSSVASELQPPFVLILFSPPDFTFPASGRPPSFALSNLLYWVS